MKTLLTIIASALRRFFAALRPANADRVGKRLRHIETVCTGRFEDFRRADRNRALDIADVSKDLDKLAKQLDRIDADDIDLDDIAQRVASDHSADILNTCRFEDAITEAAETAVAEAFAEQREAVSSETKPPSDENLSDLAEIVNAQGAEIAELKALIDAQANDLKLVTQAAEAFASALRPGENNW